MAKEMSNTLELTREQIIYYYSEKLAAAKSAALELTALPVDEMPIEELSANDKYFIARGKKEAWSEIINMFNHSGLDKISESQIVAAYGDSERRRQEKEDELTAWAAKFKSQEDFIKAIASGNMPPRIAPGEIDGIDVFAGREKLTAEEFSQRFNIKLRTVQKMIKDGRLPAEKIKNKWWISGDTQPPQDHRIKHGRYVQPKR